MIDIPFSQFFGRNEKKSANPFAHNNLLILWRGRGGKKRSNYWSRKGFTFDPLPAPVFPCEFASAIALKPKSLIR